MFFLTSCEAVSHLRQKGDSQNECFKKTKDAKFSEKRTFLTTWYAHVRRLERLLKQDILAVELASDLKELIHLSGTLKEKLKRFSQIFVYGMYVLIFYLWLSENMWKTIFCSSFTSIHLPKIIMQLWALENSC